MGAIRASACTRSGHEKASVDRAEAELRARGSHAFPPRASARPRLDHTARSGRESRSISQALSRRETRAVRAAHATFVLDGGRSQNLKVRQHSSRSRSEDPSRPRRERVPVAPCVRRSAPSLMGSIGSIGISLWRATVEESMDPLSRVASLASSSILARRKSAGRRARVRRDVRQCAPAVPARGAERRSLAAVSMRGRLERADEVAENGRLVGASGAATGQRSRLFGSLFTSLSDDRRAT